MIDADVFGCWFWRVLKAKSTSASISRGRLVSMIPQSLTYSYSSYGPESKACYQVTVCIIGYFHVRGHHCWARMASSSVPEEEKTFVPFTKAERIQQLNDIDKVWYVINTSYSMYWLKAEHYLTSAVCRTCTENVDHVASIHRSNKQARGVPRNVKYLPQDFTIGWRAAT